MRRIGLWSLALLILLFSLFLLLVPNTPVLAHTTLLLDTPTPTLDASTVVGQAQTLNNVVIIGLAVIGFVLAVFTAIGTVLTILGIGSVKDTKRTQKELRDDLEDMRKTRSALVYINIGDTLMRNNEAENAVKNYKKASSFLPKDPDINYTLGSTYSRAGYFDDAIKALKAVIKYRSDDAAAWRELGLAYRRRWTQKGVTSDFEEAISCLKKSTEFKAEDHDDTFCIIGGTFRRKKDYQQALESYIAAYHINENSSYAIGNIASLAWQLKQFDKAKEFFGKTEDRSQRLIAQGTPEAYWHYYDLALAHLILKKADAVQRYETALHHTPLPKAGIIDSVLSNLNMIKDADATKADASLVQKLAEVIDLLEKSKDAS